MYSIVFAANASSWVDRPGLRLGHQLGDRVLVVSGALRDRLLAEVEGVAVDADPHALLGRGEHVGADVVEQHDAVGDQQVRVRGWDNGPRSTAGR